MAHLTFSKRNDNRVHYLNKIIVGSDRGYNGFPVFVAFILRETPKDVWIRIWRHKKAKKFTTDMTYF